MAVCVEVDLVGSAWRADVDPRLMLVDQVRLEVLRFPDTLAYLQDPAVHLLELAQVLENIGALPPFYIGIRHASRVTVSHPIGRVQQPDVEACPVVEQGSPDEAGE